jgi:hypothetical protein
MKTNVQITVLWIRKVAREKIPSVNLDYALEHCSTNTHNSTQSNLCVAEYCTSNQLTSYIISDLAIKERMSKTDMMILLERDEDTVFSPDETTAITAVLRLHPRYLEKSAGCSRWCIARNRGTKCFGTVDVTGKVTAFWSLKQCQARERQYTPPPSPTVHGFIGPWTSSEELAGASGKWEIGRLRAYKVSRGRAMVKVHWKNFPRDQDTWIPVKSLPDCFKKSEWLAKIRCIYKEKSPRSSAAHER